MLLVLTVLLGVLYPAAVWGIGRVGLRPTRPTVPWSPATGWWSGRASSARTSQDPSGSRAVRRQATMPAVSAAARTSPRAGTRPGQGRPRARSGYVVGCRRGRRTRGRADRLGQRAGPAHLARPTRSAGVAGRGRQRPRRGTWCEAWWTPTRRAAPSASSASRASTCSSSTSRCRPRRPDERARAARQRRARGATIGS